MHGKNDPCDLPRNKYFRHRNRKCKSLVAGVRFGTGGTTGNENQPKGEQRRGWCWDKE